MATVKLTEEIKSDLRCRVMECIMRNITLDIEAVPDYLTKSAVAQAAYDTLPSKYRMAAEVLKKAPTALRDNMAMGTGMVVKLTRNASPYPASPFLPVKDKKGERYLKNLTQPSFTRMGQRRDKSFNAQPYFPFNRYAQSKLVLNCNLDEPTPLLHTDYNRPEIKLKNDHPLAYALWRRYDREVLWLQGMARITIGLTHFLNLRNTLGEVQRDWPELLLWAGDTAKDRLGSTKSPGQRSLTKDEFRFIQGVTPYAARGLLLPPLDKPKHEQRYSLFI